MNTNVRLALFFLIFLVVWFASGLIFAPEPIESSPTPKSITAVKVSRVEHSQFRPKLSLRAHTQANRTVNLSARLSGQIESVWVEEGEEVKRGQVICELEAEDRMLSLAQSQAHLEQAEIAHRGSLKLETGGYQSQLAIARSKADLETAKVQLARSQLTVEHLKIKAPFNGIIDRRPLEVGDYVVPGSVCAVLVDFNPIKISALANEIEARQIKPGNIASVFLKDHGSIDAIISYVAFESDPVTRSYRIEAISENVTKAILSGLSASLTIESDYVSAHMIPSSSILLDDDGGLFVRTINNRNLVESFSVKVLGETRGGTWVSGLPRISNVITVGQNYVVDKEQVNPNFVVSQDDA